jgi:hypothetical protein
MEKPFKLKFNWAAGFRQSFRRIPLEVTDVEKEWPKRF